MDTVRASGSLRRGGCYCRAPRRETGSEVKEAAKAHSLTRSVTSHAQPVLCDRDATSCRSKISGEKVPSW